MTGEILQSDLPAVRTCNYSLETPVMLKTLAAFLAASALLTACGQSEQQSTAADKKATTGEFKPSEGKAW